MGLQCCNDIDEACSFPYVHLTLSHPAISIGLGDDALRFVEFSAMHFEEGSIGAEVSAVVSVEDRKHGLPRIEHLRNTPAAIKFLSVEPLLQSLGLVDLKKIDWVIVGGESGRGARPIEEVWVQSLLKQCAKQDVKFFFKQWGGVNKKATGRLLNGRTYDELPIIQ